MKGGMHQPVDEEQSLEDMIKQYSEIKEKGEPCSIKEARMFYYDVFKTLKAQYVDICAIESLNFDQNIPITKVPEESLEYILDDLVFIIEKANSLGAILKTTWELYHHPEKYVAWKGELMGETIYYVELKGIAEENNNEMYI